MIVAGSDVTVTLLARPESGERSRAACGRSGHPILLFGFSALRGLAVRNAGLESATNIRPVAERPHVTPEDGAGQAHWISGPGTVPAWLIVLKPSSQISISC